MEPIAITPVRERVTVSLRKAIFNGEFAEGQEITQEEIANKLGVSRMPVREAFMLLERDGLLILKNNRRAMVRRLTDEDIVDHYEIRALLEGRAAAKAAEKYSDLSELENWHECVETAAANRDSSAYIQANEGFHKAIWELAASTKLSSLLHQLWEGLPVHLPEIIPEQITKSISEHRKILDAIKARDSQKAMQEMQAHVERSKEDFIHHR